MKVVDKTVVHNLGLCGFGDGANISAIDVLDDRIVRIRPVHYDEVYRKEDLNYWTLKGQNNQTFEPGMKSYIPPFSMAFKSRTYSKNRVPYPLIREDWDPNGQRNPQNRGKSKYRRISWDEATDIIAREIERIRTTYGLESLLVQGDGHGETKAIHGPHGCMCPMLDIIDEGYTLQARQPDSWEGWYWGAKHVWGHDPVGQNTTQFNIIADVMQNSDAVLFWGCDFETTAWGWGGQQASRIAYMLTDCGIRHIQIAPDCNYSNAVHADKWIPVLPNTDAALQLAIAYVWMTEDLYDKDYIATHADGFDWFEFYVLGDEDGIAKTPEWAEKICGVPAYTIKAFARYWAKSNVSIAHDNGGSYIRSSFAHEPARLEIYLLGMQAVGHPGRNQFKFFEWSLFGMEGSSPLPISEFIPDCHGCYNGMILGQSPASFIPKTLIPKALRGEKCEWWGHITCTQPRADQFYPCQFPLKEDTSIKMLWSDAPCWSTCWNGGNEFQDALTSNNLEFYLVQHPWFENDTAFADIILPISSKLELTDFNTDTLGGQWNAIIYEKAAIDPVVDSKSDWEATVAIAQKLEGFGGCYENLVERYTGNKSIEQQVEDGYKQCGGSQDFLDFEKLKVNNYQLIPTKKDYDAIPAGMFGFYEDPVRNPLQTPTGKLEYYSVPIADKWPDDTSRGPVAHWVAEGDGHYERLTSKRAEDYPFLIVSNHPRWRVHANMDDMPWFREIETCKVVGPDAYAYEPVWVNPRDAKAQNLQDGDIVSIYNERGSVLGGVRVTERIMPGVISQDHGTRVDSIVRGSGGLDRGGANNLICPSTVTSKNTAGEVTSGFLVNIKKVDVFELAKQYPDEFSNDNYTVSGGHCVIDRIVRERD